MKAELRSQRGNPAVAEASAVAPPTRASAFAAATTADGMAVKELRGMNEPIRRTASQSVAVILRKASAVAEAALADRRNAKVVRINDLQHNRLSNWLACRSPCGEGGSNPVKLGQTNVHCFLVAVAVTFS